MSDYLTPRQVEVYEALIKKLLVCPIKACFERTDWSPTEWELLQTIKQEGPYMPELVTCSYMASHLRILICRSNELMLKKELMNNMTNAEKMHQKFIGQEHHSEPEGETSPGLEKQCTMDKSVATVYSLVNALAATDSLYSILLKIYDHPDIACRGPENLWMMDIHIGNAMRAYAAHERSNIVAFLKGFPQQSEPGNDF